MRAVSSRKRSNSSRSAPSTLVQQMYLFIAVPLRYQYLTPWRGDDTILEREYSNWLSTKCETYVRTFVARTCNSLVRRRIVDSCVQFQSVLHQFTTYIYSMVREIVPTMIYMNSRKSIRDIVIVL